MRCRPAAPHHRLRARRGVALTRRWIPGTTYIGLGPATALSGNNRT
jgi:hypothetical protein